MADTVSADAENAPWNFSTEDAYSMVGTAYHIYCANRVHFFIHACKANNVDPPEYTHGHVT